MKIFRSEVCFASVISALLLTSPVHAESCQDENPNTEAGVLQVRPIDGNEAQSEEYIQWHLLKLALEKSQIPYDLQISSHVSSGSRRLQQLNELGAEANVHWGSIRPDREESNLPARVPLFRGLLNYSYIWVREDDVDRFSDVKTIEDLRKFTAVTGTNWTLAKIFRDAGLKVVEGNFPNIPKMLARGRGDMFIYPAMEAENFVALGAERQGLVPLTNVMVKYPLDHYFYMGKCSNDLHDALYNGMLAAFADGSHDTLMRTHPGTKQAYESIMKGGLDVIQMENNNISDESKTVVQTYKYDIE